MIDGAFWRGRKTLVTGHTGFKGAWLCAWLLRAGARVCGVARPPDTSPNLFTLLNLASGIDGRFVDVRDREATLDAVASFQPATIFHLAAQSLVLRGLADPHATFATNVMGLVNLLDAAKALAAPPQIVVVTSDKVYARQLDDRAFVETDPLGGDDPYSASKACAEIVVDAYRGTHNQRAHVCTARAGNVIGGGDWAENRLLPDIVRAVVREDTVLLRNPRSTRPWQHVLDALYGYLLLAQSLHAAPERTEGAWNFGPSESSMPAVETVATRALQRFGGGEWVAADRTSDVERPTLRVDSTKARSNLRWRSRLSIHEAISWTVDWYAQQSAGEPAAGLVDEQIAQYETLP